MITLRNMEIQKVNKIEFRILFTWWENIMNNTICNNLKNINSNPCKANQ